MLADVLHHQPRAPTAQVRSASLQAIAGMIRCQNRFLTRCRMKRARHVLFPILFGILLGGCASYSSPRYGDDGVYGNSYPRAQVAPITRAYSAHYPFWSLDHFYFSQFYSPFSVVLHPWDPWLFPYSAWHWGYPYSHGLFLAGGPWFYRAPWSHYGYRSWRYHSPYGHHPYDHRPDSTLTNYRGRRMIGGAGRLPSVNAHRDYRLESLNRQRSIRSSSSAVSRRASSTSSRPRVNRRAAAPVSRTISRPSRSRAHPRQRPPK